MIVPMKKATVVVLVKDSNNAVSQLRRLGLLHVEHQQAPKGTDVSLINDEIALIDQAVNIFSQQEFSDAAKDVSPQEPADWKASVKHVVESYKRLDQLEEYSRNLVNRISGWETWGDFDPEAVVELAKNNIHIRLYQIPANVWPSVRVQGVIKKIFAEKGMVYCVVVTREAVCLPYKEIPLPKLSLSKMRARFNEDVRAMEIIRTDIKKAVAYKESLLLKKQELAGELEFTEALFGMGQSGELSYISGFVPVDAQEILKDAAKKEKWGLLLGEPSGDDRVPTFMRNPRWVNLINPVLKLLEITPGYTELDISPVFLLFFSLFFGILIGDAGYGLVYLALTFLVARKFGKTVQDKKPFYLFYLLSSAAIVWGILTATFFGQVWLTNFGIKALVPQLNNASFVQALCFTIGAIHLSVAHLWRFVVLMPSPVAFAELGWISIIWAAFFLAKTLLLGDVFPFFGKYLIITGLILVAFFVNFQKNILKAFASGLGTLALSLMNNFTDVVSYVRLFAVGLAGVAIADAFNTMAAGSAGSGIVGVIGAVLIVVAGHALNLVLGPMSVLVHGVRLNVLEFSSHAAVTWSGTAYRPLKEERK